MDNHIQSINDSTESINDSIEYRAKKMVSHEILIKNSVDLAKYLVAVCCSFSLSNESIVYLKKHYPDVLILNEFPKSAGDLESIIKESKYQHKYRKYKSKYLKLKQTKK